MSTGPEGAEYKEYASDGKEDLSLVFARGSLQSQIALQETIKADIATIPDALRWPQQIEKIDAAIASLNSQLTALNTQPQQVASSSAEELSENPFTPFEQIMAGIRNGDYDAALPEVRSVLEQMLSDITQRMPEGAYSTESKQSLPQDFDEQFVTYITDHPNCTMAEILSTLFGRRHVDDDLFQLIRTIDLELRDRGIIAKNPENNRYYLIQAHAEHAHTSPRDTRKSVDERLREAGLLGSGKNKVGARVASLNSATSRRGGNHNGQY